MQCGGGGVGADYWLGQASYNATSEADDWLVYQVSGPNAIKVVESAAGSSVRDIGFMRFGKIRIAGHDVWALRQGMAGEVGYELQGPRAHGQEVYDALVAEIANVKAGN